MATVTQSKEQHARRNRAIALNRMVYRLSQRWFLGFMAISGLWVGLPWLAPIFMRLGWDGAANVIYALYAYQCHQMPQRSFFLFGPKAMLSLDSIRAMWVDTFDPRVLREFIGNAAVGYKVAWSDRMVSAYTSIPLGGLLWRLFRKRLRALPLWGFILMALPMAIDGGTHVISDLAGIGQGFRYTNTWLAALTGNRFPALFYAGDALGSFNSWMRLITGVLFGVGLVWFALPVMQEAFDDMARTIEAKFERAGENL